MSTTASAEVTGVLLAGGLSRRMGGGDKGLLDLAGRPLLRHVIDRLAPQVGALVINANGDPQRFAPFGLPVVADTIGGFAGPLAGILAGMRWASTHTPHARWIVTAPSDTPFLPLDLVSALSRALEAGTAKIALAGSGGAVHPVAGLWPVALAADLEDTLGQGVRKVLHWVDRHGGTTVDFPFEPIGTETIDPFFNANTPAELDALRTIQRTRSNL